MLTLKGYAVGQASQVVSVEVTLDDGKTWKKAEITYQEGRWSWTLWQATVKDYAGASTVHCRAADASGHVQPAEGKWNLRGVAYDAWGKYELNTEVA